MRVRTYNDLVRDVNAWSNAMNRIFERSYGPYDYVGNGGSASQGNGQNGGANSPVNGATQAGQAQAGQSYATLPLDVWTTNEAFHVSAYVPGIDPENVEITFEGDELAIRGQLPQWQEGGDYVRRELYHGGFERRISFSVPINADGIEAHFHNGLLTLVVPKAEAVRPKQIKVQVK